MQTARDQLFYDLPDDFGRLGPLYIDEIDVVGQRYAVQVVNADDLLVLLNKAPGKVGMPTLAAVVGNALRFYPTPDNAYNVVAVYEPATKSF